MNDKERAEAEKKECIRLKASGYGYDEFCDEMDEWGLQVCLHAAETTLAITLIDAGPGQDGNWRRVTLATACGSRHGTRVLDRAARQIRARLEVDSQDEADPW